MRAAASYPLPLDVPAVKRLQPNPSLQPAEPQEDELLPTSALPPTEVWEVPGASCGLRCPFREAAHRTLALSRKGPPALPDGPQIPTWAHFQDTLLSIFFLKGVFLDQDAEKILGTQKLCAHFGI